MKIRSGWCTFSLFDKLANIQIRIKMIKSDLYILDTFYIPNEKWEQGIKPLNLF